MMVETEVASGHWQLSHMPNNLSLVSIISGIDMKGISIIITFSAILELISHD